VTLFSLPNFKLLASNICSKFMESQLCSAEDKKITKFPKKVGQNFSNKKRDNAPRSWFKIAPQFWSILIQNFVPHFFCKYLHLQPHVFVQVLKRFKEMGWEMALRKGDNRTQDSGFIYLTNVHIQGKLLDAVGMYLCTHAYIHSNVIHSRM
jgi:hypothetical protein